MVKEKTPETPAEAKVVSEVEKMLKKLTKQLETDKRNKFYKVEEKE